MNYVKVNYQPVIPNTGTVVLKLPTVTLLPRYSIWYYRYRYETFHRLTQSETSLETNLTAVSSRFSLRKQEIS